MSYRSLVLLALFSASWLIFASALKASWPHSHYCMATSSRFLHPAINKCRVGKTRSRRSASNSIRYRRPIIFASASIAENGDGGNNLNIPVISPTRCSSRVSASIIQNSTSHDGLLIVTCDASGRGGGSKHDGIAAILRIRHGASFSSTSSTSQYTKEKGEDLIDVTARRTVPSRKSSEVAAIALGIKRALRTIPPSCRKRVLILSDSEYALDFFCGSDNNAFNDSSIPSPIRRVVGNSNKRKTRGKSQITQSMELREEAHRRSLVSLMEETPNGILFTKVRSSSRGVGISTNNGTAAANDEVWDGIGFIDHDAADYLSSITRSFVNSHDDEKKLDDSKDMEELPFYAVKSLGQEDLAWLENSDSDQTIVTANNEDEGKGSSKSRSSSNNFWKSIEVVGSEARDDRQRRNQRRTKIIQEMFGPSLPSL